MMKQYAIRRDRELNSAAAEKLQKKGPDENFSDRRAAVVQQNRMANLAGRSIAVTTQLAMREMISRSARVQGLAAKSDVIGKIPVQRVILKEEPAEEEPIAGGAVHQEDKPVQGRSLPAQLVRIKGENNLKTKAVIDEHDHTRKSVHDWARTKAQALGPFSAKPGGVVCNHHWGYAEILELFLENNIRGRNVKNAAKNTLATYRRLGSLNTMAANHSTILEDAKTDDAVDRKKFDKALDYAIMKICDYPDNLFFWPNRTETEPDMPSTSYHDNNLPATTWKFRQSVSKKNALQNLLDEKSRLRAGRKSVKSAVK